MDLIGLLVTRPYGRFSIFVEYIQQVNRSLPPRYAYQYGLELYEIKEILALKELMSSKGQLKHHGSYKRQIV
jgi:hypothetical protein